MTYSTVRDGYLQISGEHPWVADLPALDLQCPGEAHVYETESAELLAVIAGQLSMATGFPAVALAQVGEGAAVVFTYDITQCIVALHQGRIANASNGSDPDANRDGKFTGDDLFEGMREYHLRHVPQADVHQDLLVRAIRGLTTDGPPLPRLWHFPHSAPGLLLVDGDGDSMIWEDLEWTVETCERYGAHFSFFLMDAQIAEFDPAAVREVRERGHAFGPHPWAVFQPTPEEWRAEIERITGDFERAFGFRGRTLRAHSCIFPGYDETPAILADSDLRLDTSFTSGYRFQSGYLNGSALPARFVDRNGDVMDCWEQSTVHGDDTLWTTKTMLPPHSEEQCIELSLGVMRELAVLYHGVYHPYFHPVNLGGRGAVPTPRWFEMVLEEAACLGMPAPSCEEWLDFSDARRAARVGEVTWDADTLRFSLTSELAVKALTILLPPHAGATPVTAKVDGEPVILIRVPHEKLGWTALELDLCAGQTVSVSATWASA